ncbi:MAG: Zn-ribbon domain-containing OB-fold protein, partial [Deltaproteobacteria bacterium]|nr:Zn-ribbon domain-containing OB-fold protein [Deltaproteobacteria bacterium]
PLGFEQYQQGLGKGRFLGLKCDACGGYTFPPRGVCGDCGGWALKKAEMKGKGTLRSFTVIRVAPEGMKPPYIVALVELDEGPWAVGNLVDMNLDEADMGLMGRRVRLGSRDVKQEAPGDGPHPQILCFTLI